MDEFELISRYFKREQDYPNIPLAVGDDCAIASIPAGKQLVFSIDTLLPDVHFFSGSDANLIAERALRVSLSDLAAMGATPLCFTLALSLPEVNEEWLASFSEGLHQAAALFSCPLVGGDTVRGPLCISIQVQGLVDEGKAICRGGAEVGDDVFVSGPMGDGAAALHMLKELLQETESDEPQDVLDIDEDDREYLIERYFRPEPQLSLGQALEGVASSAIDVSDGLVADLGHICRASGVAVSLSLEAIPYSVGLSVLAANLAEMCDVPSTMAQDWVLHGGDDYQLCFTVPKAKRSLLEERMKGLDVTIAHIGEVVAGSGVRSSASGDAITAKGYRHFAS
ncbi:MAG: thiamine-phosphate kinase [Agarilytica sp.]